MHFDVLVEDSSGKRLLDFLLPKIIGTNGIKHTWKIHSYKGIGLIPKDLKGTLDPQKRILLDRLPELLRGYGKTPGYDAVVIIMDSDNRNCKQFLTELKAVQARSRSELTVLFRLAIEEIEAWYFGEQASIQKAYPNAKMKVLSEYKQDSICGTWEKLLEATHSKDANRLVKSGWMAVGNIKHQWAEKIGAQMDVETNVSPSFCKFRDGLRLLVQNWDEAH